MLLKKTFEIEGLQVQAERKRVRSVRLYISQKDLQAHIPFRFMQARSLRLIF